MQLQVVPLIRLCLKLDERKNYEMQQFSCSFFGKLVSWLLRGLIKVMYLSADTLANTDYLTEHLKENEQARLEIFSQMLRQLEYHGECRGVYHRLAFVLLGNSLGED